jgi:aminomethyltransferase
VSEPGLKRTPLYDEHIKLGAKMVPFAGYDMPVQYPTGVLNEHNWTRAHAGLFDVSHMGQCFIAADSFEAAATAFESLVPTDLLSLNPRQQRYSQMLAPDGGILDDLMISRSADPAGLYVVVNAGCKDADYIHIERNLPLGAKLVRLDDHALIALQGPEAEDVLAKLNPKVRDLSFMQFDIMEIAGCQIVHVSRSGYTGEDGFELSVSQAGARELWNALLGDDRVKPIGLGARDSLRLEAGLCLYGHDIDVTTSPVEADLVWSIQKRRRIEGGFPGAERIQKEIATGPSRRRVGIKPDGRAPAREGTIVQDMQGRVIGKVTSGGFGPTVNGPVAMGYVEAASAAPGTQVQLIVRDKVLPAAIVKLPFVPARFKR